MEVGGCMHSAKRAMSSFMLGACDMRVENEERVS